ncbi:MAG: hypothetical protein ABR499_23535 [Gemmatimonadaceae bacterium]
MTRNSAALPRMVCAAVFVASVPASVPAQDPARREGVEEAPLILLYRPYVRTIIAAVHYDGAFYLPFGETFAQLGIATHVDPRQATATGHFLRKRSQYRVDFRAGTAKVGERAYVLAPNSYLIGELDIFVLPSVFEQLFGFTLAVDARMLAVQITASEELPIAETFRRRERQARFAAASDTTVVPLRYPRDRRALDGGVVEYLLAAESADQSNALRFRVVAGAELLGGDLQAAIHGASGAGRRRLVDDGDWRWRYVFAGSRGLSQLTVGRLVSAGLQAHQLEGVEITNRPIEPRTKLATYSVEGVTEANAEVELYVNDLLVDIATADAFGNYRFAVPLSYGTSIARVQSYGPAGGVRREEQAIQVPFAFVPPGRADYAASVGRSRRTGQGIAHARVAVGLSERITSTVGVDYGGESVRRPVAYGSLTTRAGSASVVGIELAPTALYRASAEAFFPSRASVGATITHFVGESFLHSGGPANEWSLRGFTPVGGGSTAATLQLRAAHRTSGNGGRRSNVGLEARGQGGLVRPLLAYDWTTSRSAGQSAESARRHARVGAAARIGRGGGRPRWLNSMLLNWWQSYDVGARRARQVQLQLSTPFAVGRYLEASVTRDHATRANHLDLRLLLELPYLRSSTSVSRRPGSETLVQSVRGAVGYDSRSGALVPSDRAWAGHSSVAMRFFLDKDGDGRLDAGEEPVRGAGVRLRHTVTLEQAGPGLLRATDLPAYQRYGATIDVSGVRNPLWMPKFRAFSFVTDPNRYKRIDVPFFVGGVVEGTVVRRVGGEDRPVAGLKVHLEGVGVDFRVDLTTFSDGSFYHMGVPPGRYVLQVDTAQLNLLSAVTEPAARSFEVRETATGDFVERLDFVLVAASRPDSSFGRGFEPGESNTHAAPRRVP